ncbi:hypothetical protein SAMN05216233_107221 [Desulfoluna spongiiphila]|uniref:Uncharacterized protein n=1 Tax=Desulfoluna spongiiphila TaxID=419481 RepID=A0A1G5F8U2_9BACT|nr:hypothetical protein SAMN05216233_107221 [Desulfoluna spongiiphila]
MPAIAASSISNFATVNYGNFIIRSFVKNYSVPIIAALFHKLYGAASSSLSYQSAWFTIIMSNK